MQSLSRCHYIAVAQYDRKDKFLFYSDVFRAETVGEALDKAQAELDEAWVKISPYPSPKVVDVIVGQMVVIGNE